jgi:hypothetical protein
MIVYVAQGYHYEEWETMGAFATLEEAQAECERHYRLMADEESPPLSFQIHPKLLSFGVPVGAYSVETAARMESFHIARTPVGLWDYEIHGYDLEADRDRL